MIRRVAPLAIMCGLAVIVIAVGVLGASVSPASAGDDDGAHLRIVTLSTRPDTVSGGDVLVRIDVHRDIPLNTVRVMVNGHDVTGVFQPETGRRSLLGLVNGLNLGANTLTVDETRGKGHRSAELTLTNYPIAGPVFSGPHERPFVCMTQNFRVPSAATSTQTLGSPLDSNCSAATRVDYVYRTTAGTYKLLPNPPIHPSDLAQTTTTQGKTVPYIVRVETGTINRAIYQTAVLHDPTTEAAPSPFASPAAWNRRLVYTLGGGCVGGWYIQGTSIGNGGILEHLHLSQGYGVASSTLNVFGNNCQEVLAAETLMMVKERFVENYGEVFFTIGWGCSGGSEQSLPISDDYPGLLDGIVPGCSFPEVTAAQVMNITDADLLDHYFKQRTALTWTDPAKVAVSGYANAATIATIGPPNAIRVKAQGGTCNAAIPPSMRYDKATNPTGVRCDVYDHMVNIFGRDPATGFARRPLDNVGVQYGLAALNAGTITKQQFLDLNQFIGGYDNDGNYVATRTVGDLEALRIAYRTGRVTYGGAGMVKTPIIDYRGYVDEQPAGNVHQRFHSFSMRERLLDANGNFDNHVMLTEDGASFGLYGDASPVLSGALRHMDEWLTNLKQDASNAPDHVKVRRAKPGDLVDACFTQLGTEKVVEPATFQGGGVCNGLFPAYSSPRMVAGEPVANNVLKCQLKPIDDADYRVTFTSVEQTQLAAIFAQGVCDYGKPGVGQKPFENTWEFF